MNKYPKVLMLDPWTVNNYSYFLCSHLANHGADVTLAVTENRNINTNDFKVLKILPGKDQSRSVFNKTRKYLSYLLTLLNNKQYDLLHFQAFRRHRIEALFFFLLHFRKTRLIFTVHDVDPLDHSRTDRFLNKIVYRSADVLLAHSETNRNRILEEYKVEPSKIVIIHHGSFENNTPGIGPDINDARKYFGLEGKHNVMLCFGTIKKYKGIDLLIRAAAKASESIDNLVLLIAGKGENESIHNLYRQQIGKLKTKLQVIMHFAYINQDQVELYFKASDVVMLPYTIISHSGVLHLAWSFAKPVIASRSGDFEEFINEGETGFLFNTNNEDDLSSVILKAFESKEKLKRMGECAEKRNSEKYSWELSAQKLTAVYDLLINGKT